MAWDNYLTGKKGEFSGTAMAVRCYESHPVLKLGKGKLYGGSASDPVIKDADIYVALQRGSTSGKVSDPWEKDRVVEIQYSIRDMEAPADVPRFKKMVTWLCNQLQNGKTVHVGCIGGHGRTGTLISAIVAEMKGEKNAIQWVRKHYCKKAVESKSQVQFLMKHYGVSEVSPTKGGFSGSTKLGDVKWDSFGSGGGTKWDGEVPKQRSLLKAGGTPVQTTNVSQPRLVKTTVPEGATGQTKTFAPMAASSRSLWRKKRKA